MTYRRLVVATVAYLILTAIGVARAQDPTGVIGKHTRYDQFQFEPFGTINVLVPTLGIKSAVVFMDGDGGWNDGIIDMARLLTNRGALVVGVDTPTYMMFIDNGESSCVNVADEIARLTTEVRKRYAIPDSIQFIMAGYSSGATLAYAVLAQAPKNTYRGGITLGFCRTFEVQRPLCDGRALAHRHTKEGLVFKPARDLDAPWYVLNGEIDQACLIKGIRAFAKPIESARLVALPKVGHGFGVGRHWHWQYVRAFRDLLKVDPHSSSKLPNKLPNELPDKLPGKPAAKH